MAIAKVRIAPESEWCHHRSVLVCGIPKENWARLVGMPVEIFTDSMEPREDYCRGRTWRMTEASHVALNAAAGIDDDGYKICEHMLEMD